MGHGMSKRKEVNGQVVPYVPGPTILIAEGHAFRKSLCEGFEIEGFEWLGPNRLYSNMTCKFPEEVWLRCGHGEEEHVCSWMERAGSAVFVTIELAFEEATEIIGEGLSTVGNWLASMVKTVFGFL